MTPVTRVAIDVGALHGPRTGVGNAVAWTVDALRRAALRSPEGDPMLTPYVLSTRARLDRGERRLPLPAALAHRIWARHSIPRMDHWLGHPDVVHGTNYVVPPARAARVVTVHDCWFLDHPDAAQPDVALAGAVLARSIAEGAHVVTCADATTERVRELFDVRSVHTVHHGPPAHDPNAVRTAPALGDPDAPFVLSLGTVERRKNICTLVAAFARVAAEDPTVQLRIAGRDGDDSPNVARALERLHPAIRRRVIRHVSVSEPVKRWLLDRATVFAYPSLDEGFGFPILEAQLAGTPVVASSAGSIPEVAGSGALLSLPLDADALAANLFWVITSEAKRDDLVRRGATNVTRFDWDRTAATLTRHYRAFADEEST